MLNQVETLPNSTTLSTDELVDVLIKANSAYRAGKPLISDLEYDHTYIAELKKRDPNHSFLNSVEPEPVEDWRFLAAFGIRHLGRGDSRKIMEKHSLEDLPNLSYADIVSIDGFADKTATSIIAEIKAMWPTIKALMDGCVTVKKSLNGRQPETTQSQAAKPKQSSARGIVGRRVVFTGKMTKSRSEMEEIAMQNGMYPLSKVEYGSILVTG